MLSNLAFPNIPSKCGDICVPGLKPNYNRHEVAHPYETLILLELRQIKKQLNIEQSTTKVYKIEDGNLVNEIPVTSHQQIRDFIDSDIKITEKMLFEKYNIPRFTDGKPVTLIRKDYADDFEECYIIHGSYIQYLFNI